MLGWAVSDNLSQVCNTLMRIFRGPKVELPKQRPGVRAQASLLSVLHREITLVPIYVITINCHLLVIF